MAESPAPASAAVRELHYRVGAPVLGHFPGHHRSTRGDSGFEFRGHAALLDAPDPRRLDLHASLRDPFGDWRVRVYSQRKAIPVVVVADLSASMGFAGRAAQARRCWPTSSRAWPGRPGAPATASASSAATPRCAPTCCSRRRARAARAARLARRLRALHPAGPVGARRCSTAHAPPGPAARAGVPGVRLPPAARPDRARARWPGRARRGAGRAVGPARVRPRARRAAWRRSSIPESGRRRLVWWRPALRARWQAAHARAPRGAAAAVPRAAAASRCSSRAGSTPTP